MSIEKCIADIADVIGRELKPDEAKMVRKRVVDTLAKLEGTDDFAARVEQAIQEEADEILAAAMIHKRNELFNVQKKTEQLNRVLNRFEGQEVTGFKTILTSLWHNDHGVRDTVMGAITTERDLWTRDFAHRLREAEVYELAISGDMDFEAGLARFTMSQAEAGKISPEDLAKTLDELPEEAVKLAEIWRETTDNVMNRVNEVGGWIKKSPSYVMSRSHDMYRISRAAGRKVNIRDDAHFEKWKEFMDEADLEQLFPGTPPEGHNAALRSLFDQFSRGDHIKYSDQSTGLNFGNVGRAASHERTIEFNSWEAEWKYFQAFGSRPTISGAILGGMDANARRVGIMRKLGPNARQNYDWVFDQVKKKLHDEGNRSADLDALDKVFKSDNRAMWPRLTEADMITERGALATVEGGIRALNAIVDLGSALITSLTDISLVSSVAAFNEGGGFRTYSRRTWDILATTASQIPQLSSKAGRAQLANDMDIFFSSTMTHSMGVIDPFGSGAASKAVDLSMKFNGLHHFTQLVRGTALRWHAEHMATIRDIEFDALPDGAARSFNQHGITKEDWDIFRQGEAETNFKGNKVLNSDALDFLPDELFAEQGMKPHQIQQQRQRIKRLFHGLATDTAEVSATIPDARARALLNQGTTPGTIAGTGMRVATQFKSFIVSYMYNHLGRTIRGGMNKDVSLAEALQAAVGNPATRSDIGMLIGGGIMWGMVSMHVNNLVRGREMLDPTEDPIGFVKAATLKSGAFGLYGDILLGAGDRPGQMQLFGLVTGPTGRRLAQGIDFAADIPEMLDPTKEVSAARKARHARAVLNSVPGSKLFYTRLAYDYMILSEVNEHLNPGANAKMVKRLEKQSGQQYYVDLPGT